MNRTIFHVYSDVYTVALLRDMKEPMFANKLPVKHESSLAKLAKWFGRA